jgi:hypothetical protein
MGKKVPATNDPNKRIGVQPQTASPPTTHLVQLMDRNRTRCSVFVVAQYAPVLREVPPCGITNEREALPREH